MGGVGTGAFNRAAKSLARYTGRPSAFLLAVAAVAAWLASGPLFDFSDTWQLVINTATTVVTFLMVFLIQNTQVRDTEAMQIKLDELIRVSRDASNSLLDLEELDEHALAIFRDHYEALARQARADIHAILAARSGDMGEAGRTPGAGPARPAQ